MTEAPLLTLDFETKSFADLPQVGAWKYSQDPTTEVICLAYGIGEEEIQTWWPGKKLEGVQAWPSSYEEACDNVSHGGFSWSSKREFLDRAASHDEMPYDFYCAIASGCEVEAYNVSFEYSIYTNILVPQFDWFPIMDEQWRDLMAVAAYYAMPAKLEKLLRAMGLPGKNPEGARLISKYSKLHLKTAKRDIPPDDFQKFVEYCIDDVKGEQVASDLLGDLPPEELLVFQLDQEINKRGIPLDRKTIEDAIAIVDKRAEELAAEFRNSTGLNPTQGDKFKSWLESHGCVMENLQGKYIDKVLKESDEEDGEPDDGLSTEELDKALKKKAAVKLTPETRRALELRRKFNKASTKKLRAMLRQRDGSGRAYFQTKYHGAATGRWTGTGFQPLNLSKGFEDVPPERLVADMSHRDPAWLDVMYGDAMDAVGKASRHHIKAEKGSRFLAGDFVSIEAVLLACNAREEWKIEAFRRKDPIYELMGCKIHKLGPEAEALARADKKAFKHKYGPERFDGKTGELAFGYQGALGAWRKFDDSEKHTDERVIEICKGWREEHPAITKWWRDLESAAVEAVAYPGRVTEVLGFRFEVIDAWLAMWLPNGKRIWYFDPQLRMEMPKWHDPEQYEDCASGACDCKPRRVLTYMAQKEGQWKRVQTYGGKLCLTDDTNVLTNRGWVRILEVLESDLLWDGERWVGHRGVVSQGVKQVCRLAGVGMTPDHLVLTEKGWVDASQSEGLNRAASWLPYGRGVRWQRWEEVPLASEMRLREHGDNAGGGNGEAAEARRSGVVRVQARGEHREAADETRNVSAPGVLRMALNAGSLLATVASSVAQLRRTWHKSLRALARSIRELLGRHGADVSAGVADRAQEQRRWVLPGELSLGYARRSSSEPLQQSHDRHARGDDDRLSSVSALWGEAEYNPLPATEWVGGRSRVYDIADAGPNHRFVVRDHEGLPLIVHNCENATQAASREILIPAMLRLRKYGYNVILSVYDEIVCEMPYGKGSVKEMEEIMTERPGDWGDLLPAGSRYNRSWALDFPVRADCWEGERYKK